jgi:hypothetical protein
MCSANTALGSDCSKDPAGTMTLNAGTTYRFQVGSYFLNNYGELTVSVNRGAVSTTVVRSVAPALGLSSGGTFVTITGSGFDASTKVRFGGEPATEVILVTPRILTARAPAHAPGVVDVTLETAGSTVTSSGGFTYTKPPSGLRRRSTHH